MLHNYFAFDVISEPKEQLLLRVDKEKFGAIAKEHSILPELIEPMRERVCYVDWAYKHKSRGLVEKKFPFRKIKQELVSLEKSARQTATKMEHLSAGARAWFAIAEETTTQEMLADDSIGTSSFGHRIYRQFVLNGQKTATFMRLDQINEAVSTLPEIIARLSADLKPRDKGGRPSNQAMQLFVQELYDIWTNVLHRRFTFDQHNGKPQSEAARFGWALLILIDLHARRSVFYTAMDNAVNLRHPGRGRPRFG